MLSEDRRLTPAERVDTEAKGGRPLEDGFAGPVEKVHHPGWRDPIVQSTPLAAVIVLALAARAPGQEPISLIDPDKPAGLPGEWPGA